MAVTRQYTGAWKARAQNAYYDPASPRVETADNVHRVNTNPDQSAVEFTAPPQQDPGIVPGGQYPGMEWVINTGGAVLDQTPDSHVPPQYGSTNVHGVDYGGTAVTAKGDPYQTYPGQRDESMMIESLGPIEINPVALQRGLNSLPQNNPDGFRRGFWDWWRTNRPSRMIDRNVASRPLFPNTADVVTDTPVPDRWSNSTSPFNSLQRNFPNIWVKPQQRREPTGISDGLAGDGAAAVLHQTIPSQWVIG